MAQAELRGARPLFLDQAFAGETPTCGTAAVGDDLVETVLAGGYPEVPPSCISSTPDRLRRDRTPFGAILETFVFGERIKLASWSDDRYTFSHFRSKERNEVDIVIEDGRGQVVGVEAKASATVSARDFSGMRRLANACGDRFALGLVLYDREHAVPFGERMV